MEQWGYTVVTMYANTGEKGVREYLARRWPNWKPPVYAPEALIPQLNEYANISLQPTALRSVASLPRSAQRLSSVPLGRRRIKASLRRQEGGLRPGGRGRKGRSGRVAVGKIPPGRRSPRPGRGSRPRRWAGGPQGGRSLRPERAGRESPAGKGGRPESLGRSSWERGEHPSGSGPKECHCERKRSKSGVRPRGAGGGGGRGRRGRRAGFPPAAPVRGRAKGGRPLPARGAPGGSAGKPNLRAVAYPVLRSRHGKRKDGCGGAEGRKQRSRGTEGCVRYRWNLTARASGVQSE